MTLTSAELQAHVATLVSRPTNEEMLIAAQSIADNLRTDELRSDFNDSFFTAASFLLEAKDTQLAAETQLLRAIGNACIDHDANRQQCLKANLHKAVLQSIKSVFQKDQLTAEDLKCLKAGTGALLNLTMDCVPAQKGVAEAGGIHILLSVINAIPKEGLPLYIPNSWAAKSANKSKTDDYETASIIVLWTLRILEEMASHKKKSHLTSSHGLSCLPIASLLLSLDTQNPTSSESDIAETDCSILLLSAELLEALSLDVSSVRKELGLSSTILSQLFDFVESASIPLSWPSLAENPKDEDAIMMHKTFGNIKAAVSRSVIACASQDEVMDLVFEESEKGMGWVVERLQKWLGESDPLRGDLVICSSVMLANLARKDSHCLTLVQKHQIVPTLANILLDKISSESLPPPGRSPGEKYQILHGVVSLLKHLAIPAPNKDVLGQADIIQPTAILLQQSYDMAQPVQVAAIGLLKHLTTSYLSNCLSFLSDETNLQHLLSIISRSDEQRLKSEGTRILVNLIHSLWSASASEQEKHKLVKEEQVYTALAEMIRSSAKYLVLVNSGVTALALLATSSPASAGLVAKCLLNNANPLTNAEEGDEDAAENFPAPKSTTSSKKTTQSAASLLADTLAPNNKTPSEIKLNILQLLQILFASLSSDDKLRPELLASFKDPIEAISIGEDVKLKEKAQQIVPTF